jgi:hypothetical protein
VQKEFDRGSPSLTERHEELDDQCRRTCEILRVWSTGRVLSSLNGFMAWRRIFWRKETDGDGLLHRGRTPVSMEHRFFAECSRENGEGRGRSFCGGGRGDHEACLDIFKTENDGDLRELVEGLFLSCRFLFSLCAVHVRLGGGRRRSAWVLVGRWVSGEK